MAVLRTAATAVCVGLVSTIGIRALAAPHAAQAAQPAPPATVAGDVAADADVAYPASAPDPRVDAADAAVTALSPYVTRSSTPDALRSALRAYYNFRHAQPTAVRKPYLYYIDLGLDNRTARGYVFDMDRLTVVDGPFTVAHGRGSLAPRDGVPTRFSNVAGSYMSSLGLYVAEETYGFRGGSYRSIGLRLRGESGRFNDAARRRGIVAHGAPYVTARDAGRSEGCPAMEQHRAQRLLPMLADGGVVFIYSPRDAAWLGGDPWLNAD
jgi:hypothetical protein